MPEEHAVVLEFTADSEVDLATAARSLTGGAPGAFRLRWFHERRSEYDLEGRDLWVHEVDSSRLEDHFIERIIAELNGWSRSASLEYRFLDGNCSARILELLFEVSSRRPEYKPKVAAPIDDLRYLHRAGWIREGQRLPSLISRADESREPLRSLLQTVVNSGKSTDPDVVHDSRDDAVIKLAKLLQTAPSASFSSETVVVTPPLNLNWGEDLRVGYVGRWARQGTNADAITFEYGRGAFDWARADQALFPGSELRYLTVNALVSSTGLALEYLGIVRLDSFEPSTPMQSGLTRFVDFGFRSHAVRFADKRLSEDLLFQFGSGKSWRILSSPSLVFGITPLVAAGLGSQSGEWVQGKLDVGLRQNLLLNAGHIPRFKLLWDFRPLRWNGSWQSLLEMSLVPYESAQVVSLVKFSVLDSRLFRADLQMSFPLSF